MTTRLNGKPIPIYTTSGNWSAILLFPYIFSAQGEWIGWVTPSRQVYDVEGLHVGWLSDEPRVLRKRVNDRTVPRREPPPQPRKIRPPATVPLPPMMAELKFEVIDVLDESPELLHTLDAGELREDMD